MNYKLVSIEDLEKIYPNNYDEKVLKAYSLMDWKLNTSFRYYYSCYHYFLDKYLESTLDLKSLNDKIIDLQASININNVYKEISSIDLPYIFLRNNIFLDRLSLDEYELFVEYYKNEDFENLKSLVAKTYKKLIIFDFNIAEDRLVNYDPLYGSILTYNNALIIGVMAKNIPELNTLIKEKEREYSLKLNIPVKIFIFDDTKKNNKIKFIESLNVEENTKNKAILDMYPKYLPLGSIVLLKNGWKKVMIMGYSAIDMENKNIIYDYIACLYPEGVIRTDYNILFNHEDIKRIIAIGLIDDEQKAFMSKINDLIESDKYKTEALNKVQEN